MTIPSIAGTSAVQPQRPPQGRPEPPAMTSTAELLGMTTDELRDAQRSGTTLTDLASQKGVSKDDLVTSIAADLKANAPEGAPELSDEMLAEMATNIADGKRPQGPRPPAGQQGADRSQSNLSALAGELGVDASALLEQLHSGTSLRSLIESSTAAGYGTRTGVRGGLVVDRYA